MVTASSSQGVLIAGWPGPVLMLLASALFSTAAPAATEEENAALAGACYGCHGPAAKDTSLPALANLSAQQLLRALHDYRTGERQGTLMPRIAKGYRPAELARLAEHFGRSVPSSSARGVPVRKD